MHSDPTLSHAYPTTAPLKWQAHPALYSDGSCLTDSRGRTISIGAGFYCPTTNKKYRVAPAGCKETNTITRAELAAIWACLAYASTTPSLTHSPLTLFTDSLASLHLINRAIKSPDSIEEKIHLPILLAIRGLLLSRARLALPTLLQKVKSHSGIIGNDHADAAAKEALTLKNPEYSAIGIDNQYLASKTAWPCLPSATSADASSPSWRFASNLTTAISAHALTLPSFADGTLSNDPDKAKTYRGLQNLAVRTLPGPGTNFAGCSDPARRNIYKLRYGTIWTAARAKTINRPYSTAAGNNRTDRCHLCHKLGHSERDTQGHLLCACKHPALAALYIKRHNVALQKIQRTVSIHSHLGSYFTIMDATSAHALPHGVASTRIPAWVLPNTPADIRARMRPDLLIFQGLSPSNPLIPTETDPLACLSPFDLSSLQAGVVIHLLELGFTSHDMLTLSAKEKQHTLLVHHLQAAGWRLSQADVSHRPPLPPSRLPRPSVILDQRRFTRKPDGRLTIRLLSRTGRDHPLFLVRDGPDVHLPPHPLVPTIPTTDPTAAPPHLVHPANANSNAINAPTYPAAGMPTRASSRARTHTPVPRSTNPPLPPRRGRPTSRSLHAPHIDPHVPSPPTHPAADSATPAAGLAPGGLGWGLSPVWGSYAYGDPALLHLSRYVHIILLGTDGSLFLPLDSILTDVLQIPSPELIPLLHRLNTHSVVFTHAIIRRRRALDFDLPSVRIPFDFDPP